VSTWATAGNLLRISQRAREATGWACEIQELRDATIHALSRPQFRKLDTHLERSDLSRRFRGFDQQDEAGYERAVTREFQREMDRWQETQRWLESVLHRTPEVVS
jgi:hypothetical protein